MIHELSPVGTSSMTIKLCVQTGQVGSTSASMMFVSNTTCNTEGKASKGKDAALL